MLRSPTTSSAQLALPRTQSRPVGTTPHLVSVSFTGTAPRAERYCLGTTDMVRIGRGRSPAQLNKQPGRAPVLEVRLADRSVSSSHLTLCRGRGRRWFVIDHKSKNGTRVNGAPVRRRRLIDGDFIELGHHLLVFREHETPCQRELVDRGSARLTHPFELRTINPVAEAALAQIDTAAQLQPLLLRGEVGSGTGALARLAHARSARPGAFVPIVYGVLSAPLLRAAQQGTMFIEDVGALDLSRQAELTQLIRSAHARDIRVIAATSRDLKRACRGGNFRDDLYKELREHVVDVPPLRTRPEDIALLIRHFIYEALEARDLSLYFCRCAIRALLDYAWPGNAHQLRHVLDGASAVAASDIISVDDLPPLVRQSHQRCPAATCASRKRPDRD